MVHPKVDTDGLNLTNIRLLKPDVVKGNVLWKRAAPRGDASTLISIDR